MKRGTTIGEMVHRNPPGPAPLRVVLPDVLDPELFKLNARAAASCESDQVRQRPCVPGASRSFKPKQFFSALTGHFPSAEATLRCGSWGIAFFGLGLQASIAYLAKALLRSAKVNFSS